jgi:DNA repair protein SbcC/Rad50
MSLPRLYSISTVCLLKHYNQDYLLHSLRTDFTGSNGVGKSMIADFFQIVFIADTKYIKFATEGIDKKGRKIEKIPFQSNIGYVFFNVEVLEGKYIVIGAAIYAQGNTLVKPFIITSSIDFNNNTIEQNTFSVDKLFFNNNFIKSSGEAYTLDDLARIAPDKYSLYVHSFNTKEERINYYDWLYKNKLISINLVKESNLKAFAKVIQSFSKSKSLDIDSSNSLIEYLFEENEHEIEQEYKQQEQAVQKLLHHFKSTKENINDISSKQKNLIELKSLDNIKEEAEYKLISSEYIITYKIKNEKLGASKKADTEIKNKKSKLEKLLNREEKFFRIVDEITRLSNKENTAFTELAKSRTLFEKLEDIESEREVIDSIDTKGLASVTNSANASDLLKGDSNKFIDAINSSSNVLRRYSTVKAIEEKKQEQDKWLKQKIRECDEKEKQLTDFKRVFEGLDENSFFIKALSGNKQLSNSQQAVLFYLRNVFYDKPNHIKEGARYTTSLNLLNEYNITEDTINKGWWLKIGEINEFISNKPSLLPDLSKIQVSTINELKNQIDQAITESTKQRGVYESLSEGIIPENFNEYEFDIDLSDPTKISNHKLAAEFNGLLSQKKSLLNSQYQMQLEELERIKKAHGIFIDDVSFDTLVEKINQRKEIFTKRKDHLKNKFDGEKNEIKGLKDNLPLLEENFRRLSIEVAEAETKFESTEISFKKKYPQKGFPDISTEVPSLSDISILDTEFQNAALKFISEYNQVVARYEETKDHRDIRINEQVNNRTYSFVILEQALLGRKIRALDEITGHLEALNAELLTIADELLKSITKVFGKTENYYDHYKTLVQSLNDFFKGKLISNRFYFKIDFNPSPKLDIKWIEQLRKSAHTITTSTNTASELTPERFIEDFYIKYSGNKSKISIDDLLNPKRYFVLVGKLTDEKGNNIPGSTGESYTAVALLGIARLSIVQDGERAGLRFIILEESATLDNINFGMFPIIAEQYGYQIITMTPKPYALGGEDGWYIHHLLPGKGNKDINYPKVMSYFRTIKDRTELETYLKAKYS